jgi:hypothetical protein
VGAMTAGAFKDIEKLEDDLWVLAKGNIELLM